VGGGEGGREGTCESGHTSCPFRALHGSDRSPQMLTGETRNVHLHIHVCVCVCVCVYNIIYIYIYMCVCECVYLYIYIYIYTYIYICRYT
jgi:hypothetical protein